MPPWIFFSFLVHTKTFFSFFFCNTNQKFGYMYSFKMNWQTFLNFWLVVCAWIIRWAYSDVCRRATLISFTGGRQARNSKISFYFRCHHSDLSCRGLKLGFWYFAFHIESSASHAQYVMSCLWRSRRLRGSGKYLHNYSSHKHRLNQIGAVFFVCVYVCVWGGHIYHVFLLN